MRNDKQQRQLAVTSWRWRAFMNFKFRDYQELAVNSTRSRIASGVRRVIINAATGSGKTVIAAGIVLMAVSKGKKVLFIAHRRELIEQTCAKLVDAGVLNFGVIMSGNRAVNAAAAVQVASIQTLVRRELPPADLIIIDEAHRSQSKSYLNILANYPRAVVIGLSATPERLDGKGLDDIFDDMVVVEQVSNLIARGFLMKPVCYVGPVPDLVGVKTRCGDYDEHELADAMDQPKLIGDIVANWMRLARGKQTVAFAASVEHAKHIADEFRAAGVSAAVVSGKTPKAQREAIIADWRSGYIQVVANCALFIEGFDYPELEVCILARPTQSVSLFLQCCGRVMRTAPNKDVAIILDHAGCLHEHGQPHLDRVWTLEGMAKKRKKTDSAMTCDVCQLVHEFNPVLALAEIQPSLVGSALIAKAQTALRGKTSGRFIDVCPGCGSTVCAVCGDTFEPKQKKRDIDGIAWESVATCPHCGAQYVDDVPHVFSEQTEPLVPESTDDLLVQMSDDEVPLKLLVQNKYKYLINEAKQRGRKRGWAWHRLKDEYGEDVVRECLPRHRAEWWRAQA
jgi:DNA repair protein RadD